MSRVINDEDLELFRKFLNQSDTIFSFRQTISRDAFDIDNYYNARFDQRKLKPEIAWPKHLSKKEKVICKLNMLGDILKHSNATNPTGVIGVAKHFLKEETANCYTAEWNGISETSAATLNDLYASLVKSYNEYLKKDLQNQS